MLAGELNKRFDQTTGGIYGYLNADDGVILGSLRVVEYPDVYENVAIHNI